MWVEGIDTMNLKETGIGPYLKKQKIRFELLYMIRHDKDFVRHRFSLILSR